jgi:hypothetical protein
MGTDKSERLNCISPHFHPECAFCVRYRFIFTLKEEADGKQYRSLQPDRSLTLKRRVSDDIV